MSFSMLFTCCSFFVVASALGLLLIQQAFITEASRSSGAGYKWKGQLYKRRPRLRLESQNYTVMGNYSTTELKRVRYFWCIHHNLLYYIVDRRGDKSNRAQMQ